MAACLEGLDRARPQEGHEIVTGFENVAEAINQIEARIKHFENGKPPEPLGIQLTSTMMTCLDEMHNKVSNLGQFYSHVEAMSVRVNDLTHCFQQLDNQVGQISLSLAEGTAQECSVCGGDQRAFR